MKTNIKPVPMNDDLNSCCIRTFEQFTEEGFVLSGQSTFYDILTRHKYFSLTPKQKGQYYKKAQQFLQEKENEKPVKQRRQNFYSGNRALSVVFKAKAMALEDYFKKIQSEGKHLKDILI